MKTIKTIDIQAKQWFDKSNGNSYFSALVTLDFGLGNEKQVYVPFQYGYGDHYKQVSFEQLQKDGLLPHYSGAYWRYCEENNITLRASKQDKCPKREVISWGSN